MRKLTLLPLCLCIALHCFADKGGKKKSITLGSPQDSAAIMQAYMMQYADSVEKAMKYETGQINLPGTNAMLNIAPGFKFLNATQSQFVVHKVWGNPERPDVLGMIMPAASTPYSDSSYAFIVTYDDMGYVKDDDAKTVDYGKMMTDIHNGEAEENKTRAAAGFEPIHVVGWAEQPYFDDKQKVLHWARELKFGGQDANTLNYEVRVLGRKGVLSLKAVASMSELQLVNKDINPVLAMASFTPGNKYSDYNSGTDKVAEYTVGGLVAGAILTKVGFWAVIAKFAKLIIAGIVAAFYGVRKWLTGRGRRKNNELQPEPVSDETA